MVSAYGYNSPDKAANPDSYVGLYYPFIDFRDEGWLKLTALYWDSLRRIVPQALACTTPMRSAPSRCRVHRESATSPRRSDCEPVPRADRCSW